MTRARNSLLALLLAAPLAHALSTDRDQPMTVDADYSKMQQSIDNKPGVSYLRGNVHMVQGSMKAHGDEATIYQHPPDAKDAQGNDISNSIQRVILIGKSTQAHMEQLQDNDGGLMTADADRIDYNSDTSIAEFTGNVTVVQQDRGVFHGVHMTYNTNTGEMESGDMTSKQRVHMIMFPNANKKPATPAKPPAAKPAPAGAKPAAKPAANPAPGKDAAAPAPAAPAETPAPPSSGMEPY